MKTKKSYIGMTVMLDEDVLDTSDDGCPECLQARRDLSGTRRCEDCQAWAYETGEEIERRVSKRFPGCNPQWMPASEMGSYKAANPDSISCPDDIYEAVLA